MKGVCRYMELKIGSKAPKFTLPSTIGGSISLADLVGKKVVVYFYPKDDTPGCTIEACEFRDRMSEITEQGAMVLGISPDNLDSHEQFRTKFNLNFDLLTDKDRSVMLAYDSWGKKVVKGKESVGVLRNTFLIDENGDIGTIWRNVTPAGHADEVIEAIKSL